MGRLVYEVIKTALLAAYREHAAKSQQIVDQPTIRILRTAILDLEAQLEWGGEFLREPRAASILPDGGVEFIGKMEQLLQTAGGITGEQRKFDLGPFLAMQRHRYLLRRMKSILDHDPEHKRRHTSKNICMN